MAALHFKSVKWRASDTRHESRGDSSRLTASMQIEMFRIVQMGKFAEEKKC